MWREEVERRWRLREERGCGERRWRGERVWRGERRWREEVERGGREKRWREVET
jgi:hypothetical protein